MNGTGTSATIAGGTPAISSGIVVTAAATGMMTMLTRYRGSRSQ